MSIKAKILKLITRRSYNSDFRPENFRKILIVRTAKIGDTVCLFPLIREIKKAFPSVQIDIYASTYNNYLFKYSPVIRHVYTRYKERNTLKTVIDLLKMRANHYDLVIDTMDLRFGKALALVFINAKWLIANTGYEKRYGLDNSDLGIYYKLNKWKQIHTAERMLEFLQLLGIQNYDHTMEFPIGDESVAFAKAFLAPYKKHKLIGLNADASNQARSILDSELIDICTGIKQRDANIRILLFSTPSTRSHMRVLIKNANLDNVILEEGTASIFDAAALTSLINVMISPDTSFVHIASAFNIPTVAIFQNDQNHLKYWAPTSSKNVVIQPKEPGASIRGFSITDTVSAAIELIKDDS
jgi:ADP-heptose:LPS heptosyltransferase